MQKMGRFGFLLSSFLLPTLIGQQNLFATECPPKIKELLSSPPENRPTLIEELVIATSQTLTPLHPQPEWSPQALKIRDILNNPSSDLLHFLSNAEDQLRSIFGDVNRGGMPVSFGIGKLTRSGNVSIPMQTLQLLLKLTSAPLETFEVITEEGVLIPTWKIGTSTPPLEQVFHERHLKARMTHEREKVEIYLRLLKQGPRNVPRLKPEELPYLPGPLVPYLSIDQLKTPPFRSNGLQEDQFKFLTATQIDQLAAYWSSDDLDYGTFRAESLSPEVIPELNLATIASGKLAMSYSIYFTEPQIQAIPIEVAKDYMRFLATHHSIVLHYFGPHQIAALQPGEHIWGGREHEIYRSLSDKQLGWLNANQIELMVKAGYADNYSKHRIQQLNPDEVVKCSAEVQARLTKISQQSRSREEIQKIHPTEINKIHDSEVSELTADQIITNLLAGDSKTRLSKRQLDLLIVSQRYQIQRLIAPAHYNYLAASVRSKDAGELTSILRAEDENRLAPEPGYLINNGPQSTFSRWMQIWIAALNSSIHHYKNSKPNSSEAREALEAARGAAFYVAQGFFWLQEELVHTESLESDKIVQLLVELPELNRMIETKGLVSVEARGALLEAYPNLKPFLAVDRIEDVPALLIELGVYDFTE